MKASPLGRFKLGEQLFTDNNYGTIVLVIRHSPYRFNGRAGNKFPV